MKSHKITLLLAIFIFTGVIISVAIFQYFNEEKYVEANVLRVSGNTIIIGNNCTAIIADTTEERAYAIKLGIEKRIEDRPNIYDNFKEVLNSFNITLEKIALENFDGKFYYSDAYFRTEEKVYKLDMKPSDAMALALRTGSKMYINKTLLSEYGESIC